MAGEHGRWFAMLAQCSGRKLGNLHFHTYFWWCVFKEVIQISHHVLQTFRWGLCYLYTYLYMCWFEGCDIETHHLIFLSSLDYKDTRQRTLSAWEIGEAGPQNPCEGMSFEFLQRVGASLRYHRLNPHLTEFPKHWRRQKGTRQSWRLSVLLWRMAIARIFCNTDKMGYGKNKRECLRKSFKNVGYGTDANSVSSIKLCLRM